MIEERPDFDTVFVDCLVNFINADSILSKKYNRITKNAKYNISQIVRIILFVLKNSIPWRAVGELKISGSIHWNTVYKTFRKIVADNLISDCYEEKIKEYLKVRPVSKLKEQYTDTTNIQNKYGSENVGRNKCCKGKNITKISLMTDSLGIPINIGTYEGNRHDSEIFVEQVNDNEKWMTEKEINNKTCMADKGYDSTKIRKILEEKGYKTIIPYNKRNTKDKAKIRKLDKKEKEKYKKRVRVEYTFMKLKRFRRIDIRYDRRKKIYEAFVLMGSLYMLLKCI